MHDNKQVLPCELTLSLDPSFPITNSPMTPENVESFLNCKRRISQERWKAGINLSFSRVPDSLEILRTNDETGASGGE